MPATTSAAAAAAATSHLTLSRTAIRRLPLFFAYCPDHLAPGVFEKRMEVRREHLARVLKEKEEGWHYFGLGYRPQPETQTQRQPSTPSASASAQVPAPTPAAMAGSLMIFHAQSLSDAWARIRSDVYWTAGVWDAEQAKVEEFVDLPKGWIRYGDEGQEAGK